MLTAAVLSFGAAVAHAAAYTDGRLTVEWDDGGNAFTGKITLDGQTYPATARAAADGVAGTFRAGGTDFPFTAKLDGDVLTLASGGKTYTLRQKAAGGVISSPAAGGETPSGFVVVTRTAAGQALSGQTPDAASVHDAIVATTADLASAFDAKPVIVGAYEDAKDHRTGGATFTAVRAGRPVRGMINAKLVDHGASVAVIYAKADATPADWNALTAPPADTPPAAPAIDPAVAAVKLTPYTFPDGTGTIGLADGWTTDAASDLDRIFIKGPADQHVCIGASSFILTPDSPTVTMQKRMDARSRSMGLPPGPPMPMFIAPFSEPGEALKQLVPQISAMSVRQGMASLRLDQVLSNQSISPMMPAGKAALLEYLITVERNGQVHQTHNLSRIECTPIGPGSWSMFLVELCSPVDSYEKDKPVMIAMLESQKENTPVCQRIMAQRSQASQVMLKQQSDDAQAAQQKGFERSQAMHRDQLAGYAAHNRAWSDAENQKSRANDNFVEFIGGYRTMLDTRSGETTGVDLNHIDAVVDGLNRGDPGHYVQVPYRDEKDPLPGR